MAHRFLIIGEADSQMFFLHEFEVLTQFSGYNAEIGMIERIGSKVIYGPKTTPQEKECTDIAVCWPRWQ